jgi:hypothetical protein
MNDSTPYALHDIPIGIEPPATSTRPAAALVLGSLELWRWLWTQQFNWLGLP